MLNDIKRALLGDKEAAKWLTDAGVLLLGDCLDLMPTLPDNSVDMLFTDLPYGTTNCRWDTPIDLDRFWLEAKRLVRRVVVRPCLLKRHLTRYWGVAICQNCGMNGYGKKHRQPGI